MKTFKSPTCAVAELVIYYYNLNVGYNDPNIRFGCLDQVEYNRYNENTYFGSRKTADLFVETLPSSLVKTVLNHNSSEDYSVLKSCHVHNN